ncbi:VASP tetramerization [Trinorchestia longiramus]|nr:VASP tetramerization [Trinorchestia longiramus]
MAATLARRKAKANGSASDGTGAGGTVKGLGQKSPSSSKLSTNGIMGSSNSTNTTGRNASTGGGGGESPKPARKRSASMFGSTCDDGGPTRLNGLANNDGSITTQDLENLREDLMTHITKEVNKCKQEIIEAIKIELNRR